MESHHRFTVRLAVLGLALVFAVGGIAAFWALPFESLLRDFSSDDSFYFAGIARELATTGRSSFDGHTPTNGYQPLWTWLEVPVFCFGLGKEASVRAIRTLEVLLALGGFAALTSALWRAGTRPWLALGMLVFFIGERDLYLGMEAGTGIACLCLAAWALSRLAEAEPGKATVHALVAGGCALALCPLARLDNLAFTAAVTTLALLPGRFGPGLRGRPLVLLLAPQVLVAVAYVTWNQVQFGAAVPVSGLVKQWWSAERAADGGIDSFLRRLADLWLHKPTRDGIVFGLLAVLASIRHLLRPAGREAARGIAMFALGLLGLATGKLVYYAATSEAELASYGWYFLTGTYTRYLAYVLVADLVLEVLQARWPRLRAAAVQRTIAAAIVASCLLLCWRELQDHARLVKRTEDDWEILSWHGARWLDENVPEGTRIGSFDAGVLGFFSAARVTNLDGLVNSVEFFERMRSGGSLAGYLSEEGIDVVANVVADPGSEFRDRGVPLGEDGEFELRHVGKRRAFVDSAWRRFAAAVRRR